MTSERATATQNFEPLRYSSIEDDINAAARREIAAKWTIVGFLAVAIIFACLTVMILSFREEPNQKPANDIPPIKTSQPSGASWRRQAKLSESKGQGHGWPVAAVTAPAAAIKPGSTIDGDNRRIISRRPAASSTRSTPPPVPATTRTMRVTAYCPCETCCGDQSDGVTASGKPVSFNGGQFLAAPPDIPLGTMLRIPGYASGKPVEAIDRGGVIKGDRLDVFFKTHRQALLWGVKILPVEITDEHPTANKDL